MRRPWKRWLVGAGAAAGFAALLTKWPKRGEENGKSNEETDDLPRFYALNPDRVYLAAQETGHEMLGWKLCDIDPDHRSFRAEVAVALTPITDDAYVVVEPDGDGSLVRVRFGSGSGEEGAKANTRRIRAYFKALDARLRAKGLSKLIPLASETVEEGSDNFLI
jgi:hypothetical protein